MSAPLERALEAALFAAEEPMSVESLAQLFGDTATGDIREALGNLASAYQERGIHLVARGGRWHFETAPDLAHLLRREREQQRKLSRAATEVLAIVAYHEPVSRAEIEAIRGVQTVGRNARRVDGGGLGARSRAARSARAPGDLCDDARVSRSFRAVSRKDLPGLGELRAAGLLDPVDEAFEAPSWARMRTHRTWRMRPINLGLDTGNSCGSRLVRASK